MADKATKKTKYENANLSADANAPINIQDEAEANLNTQTESSIPNKHLKIRNKSLNQEFQSLAQK